MASRSSTKANEKTNQKAKQQKANEKAIENLNNDENKIEDSQQDSTTNQSEELKNQSKNETKTAQNDSKKSTEKESEKSTNSETVQPRPAGLLNVNDKFKTKEEALSVIDEFAKKNTFNYDIVENTRTITFTCIGKREFNCDALIHLFFKKKDNCFTVKKIKLTHKCPPEMDSVNFIENEIVKLKNYRIGEIVSILNKRNIKIGYSGVYDALYSSWKKEESQNHPEAKNNCSNSLENNSESKENDCENKENDENHQNIQQNLNQNNYQKNLNLNGDNVHQNSDLNSSPQLNEQKSKKVTKTKRKSLSNAVPPSVNESFAQELASLNPFIRTSGTANSIFVCFDIFKHLRPVTELRIVPRKTGHIFFTICYDGHDQPLIGAFSVSDDSDLQSAYNQHHKDLQPFLKPDNITLIELKNVNLMTDHNYFIKTRTICKAVYDKYKNTNLIIKVWDIINSNCQYENVPELTDVLYEFTGINISDPKYFVESSNLSNINQSNNLQNNITNNNIKMLIFNFRRTSQVLYGLENRSDPDLDLLYFNYSSGEVYEAVNTVIKLISDCAVIRKKKENGFGENIKRVVNRQINLKYKIEELSDSHNVLIENESKWNVSLHENFCTCGYFQEWGYPCTHGLILIRYLGLNSISFVSSIYSLNKELIYREIQPVLNENVKININNNLLLRRGPGRPKKGANRRYEEVSSA